MKSTTSRFERAATAAVALSVAWLAGALWASSAGAADQVDASKLIHQYYAAATKYSATGKGADRLKGFLADDVSVDAPGMATLVGKDKYLTALHQPNASENLHADSITRDGDTIRVKLLDHFTARNTGPFMGRQVVKGEKWTQRYDLTYTLKGGKIAHVLVQPAK